MEENTKPLAVFYAYERDDVKIYTSALDMYCALLDIQNRLRDIWKHGDGTETVADFYEKELFDIIDGRIPDVE